MTDRARQTGRAFLALLAIAATRLLLFKQLSRSRRLTFSILLPALLSFILVTGVVDKPAQACPDYCVCESAFHSSLRGQMAFEHATTMAYIATQFILHREVFWGIWMWGYNIGNALMMWTNELSSTAMTQIFAVGAFFDAKHQMETQRLLQMKMADAHRNYRPDVVMCTIGTAARSLGANSRNGEFAAHLLTENMLDRLTNTRNSSGRAGAESDKDARIRLLKRRFCDARDAGGIMGTSVCNPAPAVNGRNRDIDFNLTVMEPLTVNGNFTDVNITNPDQEADVLALSANLYAHKVFPPFSDSLFTSDRGRTYALDMRAIAAKHSVAAYSFGSIVGMKAGGTAASANTTQYLRAVLEQLGAPNAETESYLGARPSYYAQMELLTKKIYQDPEFYTNLYDAPANVGRKDAAIRAIRLMQDMDRFNSILRSEQALSVLLEMYIEDMQVDVVNEEGAVGE